MRFRCPQPETIAQYRARVQSWRPWFAWRPVRVGPTECRWLEWVERRAIMALDDTQARTYTFSDMYDCGTDAKDVDHYEYKGLV